MVSCHVTIFGQPIKKCLLGSVKSTVSYLKRVTDSCGVYLNTGHPFARV